jgi:hypothetical protein
VTELYEHFGTNTNHLGHLTKLKHSGTVEDFIASFERLSFQTKGMTDAFFRLFYQWPQRGDSVPGPHGSTLNLGGGY